MRIDVGIVKIYKRMADAINSLLYIFLARSVIGKDLFDQLKFDQVFQIYADLRPFNLCAPAAIDAMMVL